MHPFWVGRMRVIEVMKHEAGVSLEAVDAAWQTLPLVKLAHIFNEINFTTTGMCVRCDDFCVMFLEEAAFVWTHGEDRGAPIEYAKTTFEQTAECVQERLAAFVIKQIRKKVDVHNKLQ